jgi:hypothetical protein
MVRPQFAALAVMRAAFFGVAVPRFRRTIGAMGD